jgi:hypothetical protein
MIKGVRMISPQLLLILAILAGGYYVGEQVVVGIKKVDHAVVHVVKAVGHGIGHGLKKVVGK